MIDDLDKAIIHALEIDARQSTEKLGAQFGVNPSTIRRRIGKLISNNVLRINAAVNPRYTDDSVWALLQLNATLGSAHRLTAELSRFPCTHFVAVCLGRYDVIAYASFQSTDAMDEFVNVQLAAIEGITNCEVLLLGIPEKYSKSSWPTVPK